METEEDRTLVVGDSRFNAGIFPTNQVRTAPYRSYADLCTRGVIDLIFEGVGSVYFFAVGMLQVLTPFSPTGRWSTIAPYTINKFFQWMVQVRITEALWARDDRANNMIVPVFLPDVTDLNSNRDPTISPRQLHRRRSGSGSGNARVELFAGQGSGGVVLKKRSDVLVGDVVHLDELNSKRPEYANDVPVDVLLLHAKGRRVYVNMSSLTGERDLEIRRVPDSVIWDRMRSNPSLSRSIKKTIEESPLRRSSGDNEEEEVEEELPAPALEESMAYGKSPYSGVLKCSHPSLPLRRWWGSLRVGGNVIPCTMDNLIPAGSILAKGSDAYGVVVGIAEDIDNRQRRSGVSREKQWLLPSTLNAVETFMLFFLLIAIFVSTMEHLNRSSDPAEATEADGTSYFTSFVMPVAISYWLLFNGLIAQTLHFTLTFVRSFQRADVRRESILQTLGLQVRNRRRFSSSIPESESIDLRHECALETLGLVQAIVFDKTGTLTLNRLEPIQFFVSNAAHEFYDSYTMEPNTRSVTRDDSYTVVNLRKNSPGTYVEVSDGLHSLLLSLFLCNSVRREEVSAGESFPCYMGTSGDELALLKSCFDNFSYYIQCRSSLAGITSSSSVVVGAGEAVEFRFAAPRQIENKVWQLLYEVKYTSARGCMIVLVRHKLSDKYYLCAKGSPSRLTASVRAEDCAVMDRMVREQASEGLRVLLFLVVPLPDWNTPREIVTQVAKDANLSQSPSPMDSSASLVGSKRSKVQFSTDVRSKSLATDLEDEIGNNEEQGPLTTAYNWSQAEEFTRILMERDSEVRATLFFDGLLRNGICLGCSGVLDELQPYAASSIRSLQAAGIKTIMCTGDMRLTAVIAAQNCGLLPNSSRSDGSQTNPYLLSLEARSNAISLNAQMTNFRELLNSSSHLTDFSFGIVLDEEALANLCDGGDFRLEESFFELLLRPTCLGAVAYRAPPERKASWVRFLRDKCPNRSLVVGAVGDGANDIDMIRAASVGVGIKGGENTQAAAIADVAIPEVAKLPELILHYGKQSWERNARISHLITAMKFSVVLCLLLYDAFVLCFQASSLFSGTMLLSFNLFYGWGAWAFGQCHIAYSRKDATTRPELFRKRAGLEASSARTYIAWWLTSLFDAVFVLVAAYYCLDGSPQEEIRFLTDKVRVYQYCVFFMLLFIVNLRVVYEASWSAKSAVLAVVMATLGIFSLVGVLPQWSTGAISTELYSRMCAVIVLHAVADYVVLHTIRVLISSPPLALAAIRTTERKVSEGDKKKME